MGGEFQLLTVTAMSFSLVFHKLHLQQKYVLSRQRVSEERVKTQCIQLENKRRLVSVKEQVHQHENAHPQLTCGP